MIRIPNCRHLRAFVRRFLARRGWLVRQPPGGESRDVWKVGPLCVKRWQPAITPEVVRAKCRLSRRYLDFTRRWYIPWMHWSVGPWIEGRQADFEECNALACRHPWARDLNPSNVVATEQGLKVIDYEVIQWPPEVLRPAVARRLWEFLRIARLPGGGESRDIWKLGSLCLKRWSPRVSPAEVRERCRVSRTLLVCNSMWYVPWLHWTVARWVNGVPATYDACNSLLATNPLLADVHPGNVIADDDRLVVIDFIRTETTRARILAPNRLFFRRRGVMFRNLSGQRFEK